MEIKVTCRAGYRGEETPRAFFLGDKRIAVLEIMDRRLSPDHRYFKFTGEDKGVYIIRHDTNTGCWELTFYTLPELL